MAVSETKKKNNSKWDAENTIQLRLKLMKKTEADIINKLNSVSNKSGYIKSLIRADIASTSQNSQ